MKTTYLLKKMIILLSPVLLFAAPHAPSNLKLTPSTNSVVLHWQDNADDERGFKIYRDGIKIKTLPKNVTSYHDSGLSPQTTYTYKVVATDDYLWYQPDSNTSWQWQLSGTLNENYDVALYDIDLLDTDSTTIQRLQNSGKKVICYFSAGSYEDWREDAGDFPAATLGNDMDGWDEKWLDISSPAIAPIMIARLELAKEKGCDGVEADNVDGYDNDTGFDLTADEQLKYNLFLADEAHKRGLGIGLKNDLNQIDTLEPYFDFAVNEQCHSNNECNESYPFIYAKKAIFNAEYKQVYVDNTNGARDTMCRDSSVIGFQTLVLPTLLDDSFRHSCQVVDSNATLLFSSGFEEASITDIYERDIKDGIVSYYRNIEGGEWPISLWDSNGSALHYISEGDPAESLLLDIRTTKGHHDIDTKVLYSIEYNSTGVTQAPYQVYIPEGKGRQDLHIKYWIKLDSASITRKIHDRWRTFFEWKSKDYAKGTGFRLISYVDTDADGISLLDLAGR